MGSVSPPDPLDLHVGQHGGRDHGRLGPVRDHLWVQKNVVVEDIAAVDPTVVNLVRQVPESGKILEKVESEISSENLS
jgi:ribosomal protein L24